MGMGRKKGNTCAGAAYRRVIYRRVMCGEKGLHKRVAPVQREHPRAYTVPVHVM